MQKKQLLLTFDYELYLGIDSGSVENCLIRPTQKIIDILQLFQFKSVFFIDTLYLYRLTEVASYSDKAKQDLFEIKNQLRLISEHGHYLYLHIHPHWLDATYNYETNRWDLSNSINFSLTNFTQEKIIYLFKVSIDILNEFVQLKYPEDSIGYRAGGLFIQPFNLFSESFSKNNILYDFSVLRNAILVSNNNLVFNFSKIPQNKFIYQFEKDPCSQEESGIFMEFSMNTLKISGAWKILNSIYYRFFSRLISDLKFGDGIPTNNASFIKFSNHKKYRKLVSFESFSIENLNPVKLLLYQRFFKRNSYMHWISHPKLGSTNSLNYFATFLKTINSKYEIETDFKKFQ